MCLFIYFAIYLWWSIVYVLYAAVWQCDERVLRNVILGEFWVFFFPRQVYLAVSRMLPWCKVNVA